MTSLRSFIVQVRRRWFVLVAMDAVGRALALAALVAGGALLVEYIVALEGMPLVVLAVAALVVSLALAGLVAGRMPRRPDDLHVARFIEEQAASLPDVGSLDDALVSAVDVDSRRSDGFSEVIVAAAVERLRGIEPSQVVAPVALRGALLRMGGGALLLALALTLGATPLVRAFDTARARLFPESVVVEVLPGDVRVPAGTPLRIRAAVRNESGRISRLPPLLTVSADGDTRTVRMTPKDDEFEFEFESVDRTFEYRVTAGPAASAGYTVTALFAPRVSRIDLRYAYPAFTGLPVRDDEDGGDIYAPAGTRVRVRIHTDVAVKEGRLALGRAGAAPPGLRAIGERMLEGELVLTADDSYRVVLASADGLRSDGDTEYFIRLMDDRPPDVRILRPSSDQGITPLEEVSIEARADDDHGIGAFDLVYSIGGGKEVTLPFDRVTGTSIQKIGSRLLAAEDLGVKPGDVIAYYARARDIGHASRATEAQSDMYFLEVKPFNEEFVQAQSQAGGAGGSAQLENLISAQKEIISATWNIERRAQGGVSAQDLAQVAAAQAELRERVQQMVSRAGRNRGRREPVQRLAGAAAPQVRQASRDPMTAALEAMAMAQQQLEAKKTRDALPHEMAALNGLLEAQAEVRRREISRQAGSGSGGSNRSGQDLSALFDKELQRQQRTNYENRSQAEARPEAKPAGESAADRIRDLARRQEELNREQQQLAHDGLSAEEIKRRLERLTRDQSELRERAEALTREMSRPGQQGDARQGTAQDSSPGAGRSGQPGQAQGQAQGSGTQSQGLREAAEQMRNAAGDLARQDPGAASQSGERAAEQLRRVEQQMRAGDASAGQRAAAELQVEAQQLAQEQRRIGAEAERLGERQGNASADARRRLADEQESLAARADELERAARQQAKSGAGTSAAAGAAADELQSQRVSQQMRESAKQMRSGSTATPASPQPSGAAREQQIAQALDRVIEKLGGPPSAEAGDTAAPLAQLRAARERLEKLEQQMRSAGQSKGAEGPQQRQQQYQQELARAREALGRMGETSRQMGGGGATPEQHEYSQSAPGTEASKQDTSEWTSLRKSVDAAIERHEAALTARLARQLAAGSLSAGGSERVPASYRQQVARYYESLARVKK